MTKKEMVLEVLSNMKHWSEDRKEEALKNALLYRKTDTIKMIYNYYLEHKNEYKACAILMTLY